jgi:hypothetical protein
VRFPDIPYIPEKTTGAAPIPQTIIYPTPGYKLDSGKLRYDLLPPDIIEAITWVLTWATERATPPPYPDRNWEKGMSWMRVFAALMRHLWAWRRGEDKDAESGKSHLWHAACCLTFLVTYERTHPELDDRLPAAKYADPIRVNPCRT